MIEKQLIKKILRSTLRRSRGFSDHYLMHPTREWFSGLGVALLIVLCGIAWCGYLYWGYSTTKPGAMTDTDTPVSIYQKSVVNAALLELEARAARQAITKQQLEVSQTDVSLPEQEETILEDVTTTQATSTGTSSVPKTPSDPLPEEPEQIEISQ